MAQLPTRIDRAQVTGSMAIRRQLELPIVFHARVVITFTSAVMSCALPAEWHFTLVATHPTSSLSLFCVSVRLVAADHFTMRRHWLGGICAVSMKSCGCVTCKSGCDTDDMHMSTVTQLPVRWPFQVSPHFTQSAPAVPNQTAHPVKRK